MIFGNKKASDGSIKRNSTNYDRSLASASDEKIERHANNYHPPLAFFTICKKNF